MAFTNQPPKNPPSNVFRESTPGREPVRVVLFGSRLTVNNTIFTLYRLGFAQVNEWSPLLPSPNAGEVMSILTRYLSIS